MQSAITNQQPFPFHLTHRRHRRNHLPNYPRTYFQEPNHGRDH
jgi:hypothetical protein